MRGACSSQEAHFDTFAGAELRTELLEIGVCCSSGCVNVESLVAALLSCFFDECLDFSEQSPDF